MWKCRLETYFFQKFSEIFRKAIFCNFCLWVFLYLCSNFLMLHFWLQNVIFLSRNLFNESRGGSRTAARSKMERFVMIVNDWKPLTIITSCSILDVATALDPPPESLDYQPTNTLMMSLIVFWVKKKKKSEHSNKSSRKRSFWIMQKWAHSFILVIIGAQEHHRYGCLKQQI